MDVALHNRKTRRSLRPPNGQRKTTWAAFQKAILFAQPLKNCESQQQIEAISVIALEVAAIKLNKGLLILA